MKKFTDINKDKKYLNEIQEEESSYNSSNNYFDSSEKFLIKRNKAVKTIFLRYQNIFKN